MSETDRIEKQIVLAAPVSRVWKAIADAREFGAWFGVELDGPFVAGKAVRGVFQRLDETVIADYQRRLGLEPSSVKMPPPNAVFCTVERVDPERYFSFRWIPFGIDADVDPANEPTTLVEFTLEPVAQGTRLTIVESGFDRVPAHRRARAFRMNDAGWAGQSENITRYVEAA